MQSTPAPVDAHPPQKVISDCLEALKFAHHTSDGGLAVTSREEVEYNGLARPQSKMALGGLPSAGEVTFGASPVLIILIATFTVLVIIVAGFTRRLRGRRRGFGWFGTAAPWTQG